MRTSHFSDHQVSSFRGLINALLQLKTIQDILQIPFCQGRTEGYLNLLWTLHGKVLSWDGAPQNKILQPLFFLIG